MTRCPYCQSGRIAVEPGTSLTYPCPDCRTVSTSEDTYGATFLYDPRNPPAFRFDSRDCDDLDHLEPNDSETKGPQ